MKRRKYWGYTRYGAHEIKIYVRTDMGQHDGVTKFTAKSGVAYIEINKICMDSPGMFTETLLHEFFHVLEFFNAKEAFDGKERNGCCTLAQTVGKGLAQMLVELRQVGVED